MLSGRSHKRLACRLQSKAHKRAACGLQSKAHKRAACGYDRTVSANVCIRGSLTAGPLQSPRTLAGAAEEFGDREFEARQDCPAIERPPLADQFRFIGRGVNAHGLLPGVDFPD